MLLDMGAASLTLVSDRVVCLHNSGVLVGRKEDLFLPLRGCMGAGKEL